MIKQYQGKSKKDVTSNFNFGADDIKYLKKNLLGQRNQLESVWYVAGRMGL